jgi:hypothetical protein
MKAALELGRWVFWRRLLERSAFDGKSLIQDPERAPLVRRAFDEYATGRHTKEQLLKPARAWGLTNRRGKPLTSQAIGMLLRNQLYAGLVNVPEYGVRDKRGDFEPWISTASRPFCRAVCRTPRHVSDRIPTSRCVGSCVATAAGAVSRVVGRRPKPRILPMRSTRNDASRRHAPNPTSGTARSEWRSVRLRIPGRREALHLYRSASGFAVTSVEAVFQSPIAMAAGQPISRRTACLGRAEDRRFET